MPGGIREGSSYVVGTIWDMSTRRSESEQAAGKQAASSVLKALDLLDALAYRGGPFTLKELAELLKWPAPTVHRLLRTLGLRDYVATGDGGSRLPLESLATGG